MAKRSTIDKGPTFTVNLAQFGWVNHSPRAPVWEIPGFCYLAAINVAVDLPRGQFWPINPTVDTVTGLDFEKTAVIWSSYVP